MIDDYIFMYNPPIVTNKRGANMELSVGTKIRYTSGAGTRTAIIDAIKIGPTAKPDFMNTWITLTIPVQDGVKFETKIQIPGDNAAVKMFKIEVI